MASLPVFRRTRTLSSVSSTPTVGTGFDKVVLTAFHSSALHNGHFCTASHGGYGVDSDERQRPVFIFTTVALLSIFRIHNISYSFSPWKMSLKMRTVTLIARERINQPRGILPVSCRIPFSKPIQIISQGLSFFNPRHSRSNPLTFTLPDLRHDMTLKYWSGCSPGHGLRVVQVITEMQNGKAMPVIKYYLLRTLCRALC